MTTTRNRTDKLDELHQRLTAQVEGLISGEDWKAMLAVASRFYRYSARNIFLITAQCPQATRVGGYKFWPTVGRYVRKGESGIAILAPCVYRGSKGSDDATDGEATEAKRVLRGFRVAYVFDESQTDGEALADVRPQLLVGNDTAQLWEGVAAQIVAAGYSVGRGDCGGANGVTDFLTRTVRVRADVDDLQASKTLTHDL